MRMKQTSLQTADGSRYQAASQRQRLVATTRATRPPQARTATSHNDKRLSKTCYNPQTTTLSCPIRHLPLYRHFTFITYIFTYVFCLLNKTSAPVFTSLWGQLSAINSPFPIEPSMQRKLIFPSLILFSLNLFDLFISLQNCFIRIVLPVTVCLWDNVPLNLS